jgi:4-hydroxy-2-oxoheptanedioate aldolase
MFGERTAGGVLCVIPSAVVTQTVAAAGADFVLIDREHGPIGRENLHAMIAATAGTACVPLVRVGGILEDEVKLTLDAGAAGVVYPLVRSVADAERCVSLVRYPPRGQRGWGPFAAHARHGVALGDYLSQVEVACGILIETAEAVADIDAILAVDGIDFAIYAQYDLSTALGVHGRFDAPELLAARAEIERAAAAADVPLGCAALTREATQHALARGYRILIHGFDVLMLETLVAGYRDWT